MLRVPLRFLFCVVLLVLPFAARAQPADQKSTPLKLYCGAITTEIGWSGTLPYTMQMCPLNAESCNAEKRPYSLQPESGRADSGTHCWFADEPVKFRFEYNSDYTGGRDYVAQDLVPMEIDWRGLYPDVWCLEKAAAHFTDVGGRLGLREGYFKNVKRRKCSWNAPDDPTLPPPNSDLPHEVVGAWVVKDKECPGFFDDGARTGDVLWIQPHGIDRAEGSCWLTGLFPLTPTLPVETLCATKKGTKRTSFTFDRMDGKTMRLREGRGRRVTYKRCEENWYADPELNKAADKLKGQTLSFVLDIDAQMRGVKGGKTVDGSHTRKIELKVGDDWTLTDRMQIGDSAAPKTFKTRFGEIAVDSDGDRATWLVEDGKLKRVRERKGYYEILSWPLGADGKSVACEATMELAPTRADGKLRTVATDHAEYDVIKAEIKGQSCPTEPMSFTVAAAEKKEGQPDWLKDAASHKGCGSNDADASIKACTAVIAGASGKADATTYTNRGAAYLDKGELDRAMEDLNTAILLDPKLHVPYVNRGLVLMKKKDYQRAVEDFTKAIELAPQPLQPYRQRAQAYAVLGEYGKAIEDADAALKQDPKDEFALAIREAALERRGKPAGRVETGKPAVADKCLKRSLTPSGKTRAILYIHNDCDFEIIGLGWGRGKKQRLKLIIDLPVQPAGAGTSTIGKSWDIELGPDETIDDFRAALTFEAVRAGAYEAVCGKPHTGWVNNELRCFREVHDGKSYGARRGSTENLMHDETWCSGKKASSGQNSADACTRLIEAGLIDADGTMDRKETSFLYYWRGTTYGLMNQYDKMLADFDKAIDLDPAAPHYYHFRAIAHEKLGHHSRAVHDAQKACSMDKEFCK